MADPASWLLLEEIRDRVLLIKQDNGYFTDLGDSPVVLDDNDLEVEQTGTVIEATQIMTTSATATHVSYDVDIVVEFGVPRGDGSQNVKQLVHRALLDLSRALMLKPKDLPKFVREFTQTGAQLLSGEDASGAAFVVAQVQARASLTDMKQPESP